jgi:uncharacterized protein (DUF1684 family)
VTETSVDLLDLLDWKRKVFGLYAEIRDASDPEAAWSRWRAARDDLFARHSQSPLPEEARRAFRGLPYFDYDLRSRVLAHMVPAEPEHHDIATSGEGEGSIGFTRFAVARFELSGKPLELELFWLDGYGGGLFVSFRDGTSGSETYGAGRYLLDTVKGSDLGMQGDRLVLDFNFAYNPSCAYDPRWVCPLVPPANRLTTPIRAGERYPSPGYP